MTKSKSNGSHFTDWLLEVNKISGEEIITENPLNENSNNELYAEDMRQLITMYNRNYNPEVAYLLLDRRSAQAIGGIIPSQND